MKDFAYYCPRCLRSHNYRLDYTDVVFVKDQVYVKAYGTACERKHWVWKVFHKEEYLSIIKSLGIPSKERLEDL